MTDLAGGACLFYRYLLVFAFWQDFASNGSEKYSKGASDDRPIGAVTQEV